MERNFLLLMRRRITSKVKELLMEVDIRGGKVAPSKINLHFHLKNNGNDIIANVSLLGKMKAIIWVVWQQCGYMEHHLIENFFTIWIDKD